MKEIDGKITFFIEKIKQDELISKKHKKVCKILNYIEHLLILSSSVTWGIFISAFAPLIGIFAGIYCKYRRNLDF